MHAWAIEGYGAANVGLLGALDDEDIKEIGTLLRYDGGPPATTEPSPAVPEPPATTEPSPAVAEPPATTEPPPAVAEPPATTEPSPAVAVAEPPATTEPSPAVAEPPATTEPSPAVPEPPATIKPPPVPEWGSRVGLTMEVQACDEDCAMSFCTDCGWDLCTVVKDDGRICDVTLDKDGVLCPDILAHRYLRMPAGPGLASRKRRRS